MNVQTKLIPISYYDPKAQVRLSAYADTLIFESQLEKKSLCAIRFGGYPEMVGAMSDAIYGGGEISAEATLLATDSYQESNEAKSEEKEQQNMEETPRKYYIFCSAGDADGLFKELDRKTAVPLIPAFQDYVLSELQQRGYLKRLAAILLREKLQAWVLFCTAGDRNIVEVLEDGLHSGKISIPGTAGSTDGFDAVTGVTSYLNAFGVTVAERIRNQFLPLFNPAEEPLSSEILEINNYIRAKTGYNLYDAQLAVAESIKRQLTHAKCGFIVAECGSGKTKIGATAMGATYSLLKKGKTFNVVLCPSHVSKKWVRELEETLPNTIGMIVKSIANLDQLYALYEAGTKAVFAIISKERAHDGYMKMPAAVWNQRKKAFICPDCMQILEVSCSKERPLIIVVSLWQSPNGNMENLNEDYFYLQSIFLNWKVQFQQEV